MMALEVAEPLGAGPPSLPEDVLLQPRCWAGLGHVRLCAREGRPHPPPGPQGLCGAMSLIRPWRLAGWMPTVVAKPGRRGLGVGWGGASLLPAAVPAPSLSPPAPPEPAGAWLPQHGPKVSLATPPYLPVRNRSRAGGAAQPAPRPRPRSSEKVSSASWSPGHSFPAGSAWGLGPFWGPHGR